MNDLLQHGLGPYTMATILTALTAGKAGSDTNYFLEFLAACILWAAVGGAWLSRRRIMAPLALTLLIAQLAWCGVQDWQLYRDRIAPKWQQLASYHRLYAQVQTAAQQGQILSDDRMDMVLLTGQRLYYQPFEYRQLDMAGLWDPAPLVAAVRAGRFPMILMTSNGLSRDEYWPPEMATAISTYASQGSLLGSLVYRP
jgi:hypothetical protein